MKTKNANKKIVQYADDNSKKVVVKVSFSNYLKFASILLIIITLFVWLGIHLTNDKAKEINYINEDYTEIKGIIIDKSLYKGKSITVKYLVKGKYYVESDGFSKNLDKQKGDSIYIKYSNKNPTLMVSECNWDY